MTIGGARARLAVVASHPVQYWAPWFRALAGRIDLEVLFAHRMAPTDHARSGFGVAFEWNTPILDGYSHAWLENIAARPGPDHFWGCNTPAVGDALAAGRFDAVLVTGWNLYTYWQAALGARRLGLPVMVRGDSQLQTARTLPTRAAKRAAYPWLLRTFDACLAVGTRSAEYYQHYGVPGDRIFHVPHCVDADWFAARASDARQRRDELRRAFGIPAGAVVFAFVGKMIGTKRPFDFVQAVALAGESDDRIHGLLVGEGELLPALKAGAAGRCAFAGFINQREMPAVYAAADALVLPSDAGETWGLVVNEAMACGLPVIVSDRAGCAPDLAIDGCGATYPCGDVAALAASIGRLASDAGERAGLGRSARRRAAMFSAEAAAAGVVSALDAIAGPRHLHVKGRHVCDVSR